MTVTQRDYLAQKAYYDDQARAAARERLAQIALSGRERGDHRVSGALSWIGARLVAWGTALRAQYGGVVQPQIPPSAHPARGQ